MVENPNTLSIVIPTIGRKLLEDTLESVLEKQTVPPDEVIVFDNSGTGKVQSASRFSHHPLITWKVSRERKSITDSWNTAVSFVTKEYVHICGDDDLLYPDFVEKVKEKLKSDPGMVYCEPESMDAEENHITRPAPLLKKKCYTVSEFWDLTYSTPPIELFLSSIVFKKTHFDAVNGFKNIIANGLMMDHLFHLEIAFESSSVMILHPPRWKYRRAVTDWSGACKSQEEKKLLPGQFRNYLQTVHQLFNHKGLTLSSAYDAHVLRGFLAMILSPSPDASKLFFGLIHICFARYINLKNNIDLLRDLFYIVRHY